MATIYIKRYYITYNNGSFFIKEDRGKEIINLKATTWEEAEKEAEIIKEKLQKENKNKNVIIVID